MREIVTIAAGLGAAALLAGCAHRGFGPAGPDEYAVARQAPLVVPPDYSLVPPQPGVARPQDDSASQQALEAMFGGPAPRSSAESATLNQAGNNIAQPGVRSSVGSAETKVIDKGQTTRAIIAAPQGDGRNSRVTTP